ncbi:MAG: hypothetical protein ACETWB_09700 [Anaerolineae bacterium]
MPTTILMFCTNEERQATPWKFLKFVLNDVNHKAIFDAEGRKRYQSCDIGG